jgi:hypothetical protein
MDDLIICRQHSQNRRRTNLKKVRAVEKDFDGLRGLWKAHERCHTMDN